MPGISIDIDNLKREIRKTEEALNNFYFDLGLEGCSYHRAIDCPESNGVFQLLCSCKSQYDEVNQYIDGIRSALNQIDNADREINKNKLSIKEADERKSTLIASLGAVACELASQGKLPKSLEKCLEGARTFDAELQKRIAKRDSMDASKPSFLISIAERRVEAMKNNINSIFYETGKKLLTSENFKELQNERVQAITDELELLKAKGRNYRSIVKDSEDSKEVVRNSLKDDNKTLREMLSRREEIKTHLDSYYTQYGEIIASDMDRWLDSGTPKQIVDICSHIRVEKKRLSKQNLNLDYLLAQKDIELSESHKEQLNVQLRHLLEQKTSVEKQIQEVQNKITSIEQNVENLRLRQTQVSRQAKDKE